MGLGFGSQSLWASALQPPSRATLRSSITRGILRRKGGPDSRMSRSLWDLIIYLLLICGCQQVKSQAASRKIRQQCLFTLPLALPGSWGGSALRGTGDSLQGRASALPGTQHCPMSIWNQAKEQNLKNLITARFRRSLRPKCKALSLSDSPGIAGPGF